MTIKHTHAALLNQHSCYFFLTSVLNNKCQENISRRGKVGTNSEFIGSGAKARCGMLKHLSLAVTKAHALMPVAVVIFVF